ncbi:MAG: hypothetical protein P8166_15085 [Candidatus Thiodiazotropha sp.]
MNLYPNWSESIGHILEKAAVSTVLWATILAFLGFILAIIVIGSIHRGKLLHRNLWIWNIFAKFSYLLIMFSFVITGIFTGALLGAQRTLDDALIVTMKPVLKAQMPALREHLAGYISPMARDRMLTARDLVEPIVKELVYTPEEDSFLEAMKAKIANEMLYKIAAYALTQAFQQSMKNVNEFLQTTDSGVGETLIEFSVDTVLKVLRGSGEHVDFTALDNTIPELFTAAMQKQLNSLFYSLYIGLAIKLLFVAAIVWVEMLIYFKYYLPRNQSAVPELT